MNTLEANEKYTIHFAIITPSNKRAPLLTRAIKSVKSQTYKSWEMITINDSPTADYTAIEHVIKNDPKITYIKNKENYGKNFSLNIALKYLREKDFSGYIIFLDDDDWLDTQCLHNLATKIIEYSLPTWVVSNRVLKKNTAITKNKTGKNTISYYTDYLIFKKFSGDATHCIRFQKVKSCVFPRRIKNGEEWIYFSQVAQISKHFKYMDISTTYSTGYSTTGLTNTIQTNISQWNLFYVIIKELNDKKCWNLYVFSYVCLRFFKLIYKLLTYGVRMS